jgi:hypothetical protein
MRTHSYVIIKYLLQKVVGAGGVKPSLPSPPHYESNITVEIKLKK